MANDTGAGKIDELRRFVLVDNSPNIEAGAASVEYHLAVQGETLYSERVGYDACYQQETAQLARVERILTQGTYYLNALYTFRSSARALPSARGSDEQTRRDLSRRAFQVLRPEIDKICDLMDFQKVLVDMFCEQLRFMADALNQSGLRSVLAEASLDALVRAIDLVTSLDYLKDTKTCIKDDFTRYKRAFSTIDQEVADRAAVDQEIKRLQSFLSDPRYPNGRFIFQNLMVGMRKIQNHEPALVALINYCVRSVEKQMYLTPEQKHRPIRTLPYLLQLLDSESCNAFRHRDIDANSISKICREHPVVPLYNDMVVSLIYILKDCHNFDYQDASMRRKWSEEHDLRSAASRYALSSHWVELRDSHSKYMVDLQIALNRFASIPRHKSEGAPHVTPEDSSTCLQTLLRGVRLLSRATSLVLEQAAWKHAHAAPRPTSEDDTFPGIEYALAVGRNYSAAELKVLIDVVSMIKSLASMLGRAEATFAPVLRSYMHHETQVFIQHTVLGFLYKAQKHKRKEELALLLQIRATAADWMNGIEPFEDYKSRPQVKRVTLVKRDEALNVAPVPQRCVAPSTTQLHLLRSMIWSLYHPSAPWMRGGLFSAKVFSKADINALETFYEDSFFFPQLLRLSSTVRECSELGWLWFREFYLEMTKQVQFPISMSLPWILIEHVILNPSNHMMENMLYAMDIYNDAAHTALYVLGQQFIYDEIEAEVNLVFEQLIFLLSNSIYSYYKNTASMLLLDKAYHEELQRLKPQSEHFVEKKRFDVVLEQRHVQLLGRSIHLHYLIAQRLEANLRQDIDATIERFEAGDITGVVQLEDALRVQRKLHKLLSEHVTLDRFDVIYNEINESTSPTTLRGRIAAHALTELVEDVFPGWVYNSSTRRFLRSPTHEAKRSGRKRRARGKKHPRFFFFGGKFQRVYDRVHRLQTGFLGEPHMHALVRLLATSDLPMVVDQLMSHLEFLVLEKVGPYVAALRLGLRPIKLPGYHYRAGGSYLAIQTALSPILEYEDLKPYVFQAFREMGNLMAAVYLLENCLQQRDMHTFVQVTSFLGIRPEEKQESEPASRTPIVSMTQEFVEGPSRAMINPGADALLEQLPDMSVRAAQLYGGTTPVEACTSTRQPLLRVLLEHLLQLLKREPELWVDEVEPSNGVIEPEATIAFHRLFSALQFMYCMPRQEGEQHKDADEFGDGIAWAGCAMIHLLRQKSSFELLDFAGHILNVNEWEGLHTTSAVGAVDELTQQAMEAFIPAAVERRRGNVLLFALFCSYFATGVEEPVIFSPPDDDSPEAMGNAQVIHEVSIAGHHRKVSSIPDNFTVDDLNVDTGPELPRGWEACKDSEGETYYWNTATDETRWEIPT